MTGRDAAPLAKVLDLFQRRIIAGMPFIESPEDFELLLEAELPKAPRREQFLSRH